MSTAFSLDSPRLNRGDDRMVTQFITVKVCLAQTSGNLQSSIEAQLRVEGEPLRWAVTAVHQGVAQVEAVVIQGGGHLL